MTLRKTALPPRIRSQSVQTGAAQGSGQSLHREAEAESLVSHRPSQGKQGAGRVFQDHSRIVSGAAAAVDEPAIGNRLPQIMRQSHLSAGGDGGGHVQDQRSPARGHADPHGIGGEAGVDSAESRGQPALTVGVGHHDGRHALAGDHSQVVAEAAQVVAVAHTDHAGARFPRLPDTPESGLPDHHVSRIPSSRPGPVSMRSPESPPPAPRGRSHRWRSCPRSPLGKECRENRGPTDGRRFPARQRFPPPKASPLPPPGCAAGSGSEPPAGI